MLTVAGWGVTDYDTQSSPSVLQKAEIPVTKCNDLNQYFLCAGHTEGQIDACQGDSGGPLFENGNVAVIHGVVSSGKGCALPNTPGMYARVSDYKGWIKEKTGKSYWNGGSSDQIESGESDFFETVTRRYVIYVNIYDQ